MEAFLWGLVVYLWLTGGLGWIDSYEARENTEFTFVGKAIVMVLHPFMSLVSILTILWDDMRAFVQEVSEEVSERLPDRAGEEDEDGTG